MYLGYGKPRSLFETEVREKFKLWFLVLELSSFVSSFCPKHDCEKSTICGCEEENQNDS